MGIVSSRWLQWITLALVVCVALQGCTNELWEQTLKHRHHRNGGWVIVNAVLMTPLTLAFDAALVFAMSWVMSGGKLSI